MVHYIFSVMVMVIFTVCSSSALQNGSAKMRQGSKLLNHLNWWLVHDLLCMVGEHIERKRIVFLIHAQKCTKNLFARFMNPGRLCEHQVLALFNVTQEVSPSKVSLHSDSGMVDGC